MFSPCCVGSCFAFVDLFHSYNNAARQGLFFTSQRRGVSWWVRFQVGVSVFANGTTFLLAPLSLWSAHGLFRATPASPPPPLVYVWRTTACQGLISVLLSLIPTFPHLQFHPGPLHSKPPWWLHGKESACSAGDVDLIPGSGRSPAGGNGNLLQYSCWDNPMEEPGGLQFTGRQRVGCDWGCTHMKFKLSNDDGNSGDGKKLVDSKYMLKKEAQDLLRNQIWNVCMK